MKKLFILYGSKQFLFSMLILSVIVVTIDLEVSNIADFADQFLISNTGILTFIAISSIFWISQTIFYYSIKDRLKAVRFKGKNLFFLERLLTTSFWILIFLNFIMIIEMLLYQRYSVYILVLTVIISYSLNTFFMSLLSFMLLSWNKTRKNSVLLSYGLASISASVSAVLTAIYITGILLGKTAEISSTLEIIFPIFDLNSILGFLNITNTLSFLSSFILIWIGSALVLKHYSSNIPKSRYVLLIVVPLIYYIGQYFTILNILFPFVDSSSTSFIYYYSIFFTLSSVVGSVIFAITFWLMARDLSRESSTSTYLRICGYGLIMFFSSATATVVHTPYPAFGMVSISLVGLSSYYILHGFYSSSVSLSEDITLRLLIRKSISSQLAFLSSMSTGYILDKVVSQVVNTTRRFEEDSMERTGISSSLSNDEIKMYIKQIVEEFRTKKGPG